MADTQETIADIIAEMRSDANADEYTPDGILGQKLNYLADRLETAHKREMSKIVSKNAADFGQFGNAAAMREALVRCADIINKFGLGEIVNTPMEVICDIEGIINAALSAPPRNCDVGTAEEQTRRFRRYCDTTKCEYCESLHFKRGSCSLEWAQMPYEEGGAK